MSENERLRQALLNAAEQCDRWADESQRGGWSTHQVSANRKLADELRRVALRRGAA